MYEPGDILCKEGENGDGMYIVMTGKVDILKRVSLEDLNRADKNVNECKTKYEIKMNMKVEIKIKIKT